MDPEPQDQTPDVPPAEAPAEAPKKKRRRWLRRILLGLLFLLLITVALLPTLISIPAVRERLLAVINERSPIELSVDDWTLKWFSSMQFKGITFTDPEREMIFHADHVHIGSGLATLLLDPMKIGSLTAGGAWIRMANPHGPPFLIRGIDLELHTGDEGAPTAVSLSAQQGGGDGSIALDGKFRLPDDDHRRGLSADGKLTLAHIDLAPLTALMAQADVPSIGGTLDGMAVCTAPSANAIDLRGKLELKSLALKGGPLGTDTPSFDLTELNFHVARQGDKTALETFQLTSPVLSASVSGALTARPARYPIGELTADAVLDVAGLCNQLPATLGLRKGLQLTDGRVLLSARYAGTSNTLNCTAVAKTSNIKARHNEQDITLNAPIEIITIAADNGTGLRLNTLRLSSSFAEATGSGSLTNLNVDLVADLAKAATEAGKFADLQSTRLKGGLTAAINSRRVTDHSSRLSVDANLRNFSLNRHDAEPWYQRRVKLTLDGLLNLGEGGALQDVTDLSAGITADTGALALTAKRLVQRPGARIPVDINDLVCRLRTNLAAANSTNLAARMNGSLTLNARGSIDNNVVALTEVLCRGSDVSVTRGNTTWTESDLSLRGRLQANLPKGIAAVGGLELDSRTLSFKGSANLTDLDGVCRLHLKGGLTPDLARLSLLVAALTRTRIEMEGREARDLSLRINLTDDEFASPLATLEGSLGVYFKRIQCFGVEVRKLDPTLTMQKSQLTTTLKANINGGVLLLPLTLNLRGKQPLLTVAPKTQALTGVPITDDMIDDLLSRLHPALAGCNVTRGTVDLFLDELSLPLGTHMKRDAKIVGKLVISDVEITPKGMLQELLVTTENKIRPVTLDRQEIPFTCRNGRLVSAPLVLRSKGNTLTFRGSTGLDGSLRYTAELPITPSMVSDRVYPYLKDTVIRLDIGGTVKRPEVSHRAFQKALQRLVRDASRNVIETDLKDRLKDELKGKIKDKDLEKGLKILDDILKR
jgi:hypothetical protein